MTWDELVSADPDLIIVTPCGFDIPRTLEEMYCLSSKPEWPKLRAVEAQRVFLADGNQYFNRPGPRLVESLEIMAELFHPAVFSFGHQGSGWLRYEKGD
jgi:iron complex transport system substrate-binding protein